MNCPNLGKETLGYVCKPLPEDTPFEGFMGKYNEWNSEEKCINRCIQAANDFGEGCCEAKSGPNTVPNGPPWLCCRFVSKTDIIFNVSSNSKAVSCKGILRFDSLNIIHLMVE